MKQVIAILCLTIAGSAAGQNSTPPRPDVKKQIVTAAQVNGVYRLVESEFRILALGHNKLRVQFTAST